MLQKIRNNASGVLVKGIMWLLVVAFVGTIFLVWGMGGENSATQPIARIGNLAVTSTEFQKRLDIATARFDQYGNLPPEFIKSLNIEKRVLDELVREKIELLAAEKAGIEATDEEVAIEIRNTEAFKIGGSFDKESYINILKNNKLTVGKYEGILRQSIKGRKLLQIIFDSVEVTEQEIKEQYGRDHEKVKIRYATVDPSAIAKNIHPSKEDIQKYFDENKIKYQLDERREVEFLYSSPEAAESNMTISAEKIAEYYEKHQNEFRTKEQFRASHILVKVPSGATKGKEEELLKRAEDYLSKVEAGMDFAKAATEFSEGPSGDNGGDLGWFGRGQMVQQFEQAVTTLAEGEVTKTAVKTQFGYHIIKLTGHKPESISTIDEVRDGIEQTLRKKEARREARNLLNSSIKNSDAAKEWSSISIEKGFRYKLSSDKSSSPLKVGADWKKLINRAKTLKVGEHTAAIELSNGFYAIKLLKVTPSRMQTLEEVKEDVTASVIKKQASDKAKETAQGLAKGISAGGNLTKAAKEMGLKHGETGLFSRAKPEDGIASKKEIMDAAFQLLEGEAASLFLDGKHYIIQAAKRIAVNEEDYRKNRVTTKRSLLDEKRITVASEWRENLLKKVDADGNITIRKDLL